MGFKEKFTEITNKATDVLINAKMTYEKNCLDVDCFSLKNVREKATIPAMLDKDNMVIEFSGVLDLELKDVTKPWFFLTPDGDCFVLEEDTIKQETIEVALKSKTEKHVITTAKFKFRTLALITK